MSNRQLIKNYPQCASNEQCAIVMSLRRPALPLETREPQDNAMCIGRVVPAGRGTPRAAPFGEQVRVRVGLCDSALFVASRCWRSVLASFLRLADLRPLCTPRTVCRSADGPWGRVTLAAASRAAVLCMRGQVDGLVEGASSQNAEPATTD